MSVRTPYEIAVQVKSLMDQTKKNQKILDTVGIKRSQLTTCKTLIKQDKLDELKAGKSIRQILLKEKNDILDSGDSTSKKDFNPQMIASIENNNNEKEDINLEYFVGGEQKFFVPSHHSNLLRTNESKEILMAENMILRYTIKNGKGKRIEELKLNELLLKGENKRLKDENEKLFERIRKLEEKLRG